MPFSGRGERSRTTTRKFRALALKTSAFYGNMARRMAILATPGNVLLSTALQSVRIILLNSACMKNKIETSWVIGRIGGDGLTDV